MQAPFDGKPLLCTCLIVTSNHELLKTVAYMFTVCNDLINIITDLYGIADLFMQLKLSWVQFLKRLSLTDLDQDSKIAK